MENIGRINKKLHDDFGPYVQLLAVLEFCFIIAAIFTFALAIARGEDRGTSEGSTIGFIVATVFLIIFAIIGASRTINSFIFFYNLAERKSFLIPLSFSGPFFIMHFKKKQTENALLGVQAWLETHWNPKMERHGVEWSIKTIEESGIKAPCSHVLELACYPGTLHREASDVKINTEAVDVMIDVGDTGALEIDEEDDDDDADDSDSKE